MTFFSRQLNLLRVTVPYEGYGPKLFFQHTSPYEPIQKSSTMTPIMTPLSHHFSLVTTEPCVGSGRYSKGVYKSLIHSEIHAYTRIRCKPIKTKGIRGSFLNLKGFRRATPASLRIYSLKKTPKYANFVPGMTLSVTSRLLPGYIPTPLSSFPLDPRGGVLFPLSKLGRLSRPTLRQTFGRYVLPKS